MLTDLHLQKYLQGRLSGEEEAELEAMFVKNPALKQRLEELQERNSTVMRPMWERMLLEKGMRRGSRVRYSTILPGLLILLLILGLTSHWFNKPGRNSTFLRVGGNGTAVELLYNSAQGWRYIDAGFRPGDSLTVAVRDAGRYSIRVFAVYAGLPDPVTEPVWFSPEGVRYASGGDKPLFASPRSAQGGSGPPQYMALVYDTGSLAALAPEELISLLTTESGGDRAPAFHYQVLRVPVPETGP